MKRRPLVISSAPSGVLAPASFAQKAQRLARIGYLAPTKSPLESIFRQ
jgi:hypothetical protein